MIRPYFQDPARGGFSADLPGEGSQSMACSPCRFVNRVLVPVNAFGYELTYYMPVSRLVKNRL
jgi:hypothetical protein